VSDAVWIDVGGTRTTAWRGRGPGRRKFLDAPSDPAKLPAVVRTARPGSDRAPLVIGLRGAWTPAEKRAWRKRLSLRPGDTVLSDIELAHAWIFNGGDGIVLNAGTGAIAFGRRGKKTARAGGLGPLIGDDGSAFWIGREWLRRAALQRKNFARVRGVVTSPNAVAAVAAQATKALASDTAAARAIITAAQKALAALAADVRRQLGGGKLPVATRGGLFRDASFRRGVERALRRAKFTI